MTKFESQVKHIQASQEAVYTKLSDLNNLQQLKDLVPPGKLDMIKAFDSDSITVEAPGVGEIKMVVVERTPSSCIKFASEKSPMPFNLWIQLLPVTESESKVKLTVGVELNPFLKAMVQKPLTEAVERMANALTLISY